jgi:hypothetical protein
MHGTIPKSRPTIRQSSTQFRTLPPSSRRHSQRSAPPTLSRAIGTLKAMAHELNKLMRNETRHLIITNHLSLIADGARAHGRPAVLHYLDMQDGGDTRSYVIGGQYRRCH